MAVFKSKPDAAESNAGDDFHVLWSAHKCLNLLNFSDAGLKAVSIEGLTELDEQKLDANSNALLGVDITEYFGGEQFSDASKVIVSQLKYSTRNPNRNWTAVEICKGKTHATRGSIIERLATFFKDFGKKYTQPEVIKKLSLKLVSNRPASTKLLMAITEVRDVLSRHRNPQYSKVIDKLSSTSKDIIQKIKIASQLSNTDFLTFVSLLDFTDCNADSRLFQQQKLIEQINKTGHYEAQAQFNKLYMLALRKMMPESRGRQTITQADVLLEFGFSELRDLLPIKAKFDSSEYIIEREQIADIISEVSQSGNSFIAIHASAGIGKSTFINQLTKKLPAGSESILFDCYGAGAYLDSDDKRHKPEHAFLQICNELAIKTGSPLLLVRDISTDRYITEFRRRMEIASAALRKTNSSALLVIIIDAADNSITAAEQDNEVSFVTSVIKMSVPEGCKIIVTSRTGRLNSLAFLAEYKSIELKPFTISETGKFLRHYFPGVSIQEVEEFRMLTSATPRVMAYALSMPGQTLRQKLGPLKPGGKQLSDLFKQSILVAEKKCGDKNAVKELICFLIALPRPVPLSLLESLSSISKVLITDIFTDLWRGIMNTDSGINFRDEDFENFLRDTYPIENKQRQRIADYFIGLANTDEYASSYLGQALAHAGRKETLRNIVIDRQFLKYPSDPLRNKDVFIERTRLAMKLSASDDTNINLLKLQMIAAEAAKSNDALERILLNNAELASAYGDLQMNQRLYFQQGQPEWFGRVHLRSAAIYSRDISTHELAKEHLKKAESWIEYRNSLDEDQIRKFSLYPRDIAFGAEAYLRLYNPSKCIRWLNRWNNKRAIFTSVEILLNELFDNTDLKGFNQWILSVRLPLSVVFLLIKICFEKGVVPPIQIDYKNHYAILERAIKKSIKYNKKKVRLRKEILAFCEYSLRAGVEYGEIKHWLDIITFKTPERVPSFVDSYNLDSDIDEMDIMFRKSCMREIFEESVVGIQDFYPQSWLVALENQKKQAQNFRRSDQVLEEKRKFDSLYKYLQKAYRIRALAVLRHDKDSEVSAQMLSLSSSLNNDYDFYYSNHWEKKYVYKYLALKILDACSYMQNINFFEAVKKCFVVKFESNIIVHLAMAGKMCTNSRYHTPVLQLLNYIDNVIAESTLPASEQLDHYTRCTIIASSIAKHAGKHYFDKMVLSSSEVDEEAKAQLSSFSCIVRTEKDWQQQELAQKFSQFTEYCSARLGSSEYFPWEQSILGIVRLNPATAITTVCRWDHGKIQEIDNHFMVLLLELMREEYIDHETAAALLPLNIDYWPFLITVVDEILKRFDRKKDAIGKETFARFFISDLKTNFSPRHNVEILKLFWESIHKRKYLSAEVVSDYKMFMDGVLKLRGEMNFNNREDLIKSEITQNEYRDLIKDIDPTNMTDIEGLIKKIQGENENGYINAEGLFKSIRSIIPISKCIDHLDVLINMDPELISFWSYKHILLESISEWNVYPGIRIWKKTAFKKFIKNYFNYLIAYDYTNIKELNEFSSVFDVSQKELGEIVLALIPEHIDQVGTAVLYELLQITGYNLSKNEKEIFLLWLINRWTNKIKNDSTPDISFKYERKHNPKIILANFLRYHLGHSDKRLRWRAAHSLRRFASFEKTEVFELLLKEQNVTTLDTFLYNDLPFYWLSAKLYLWISLDRIAKEKFEVLAPFSKRIIQELKRENLPHALILYFVKSVCSTLLLNKPNIFVKNEIVLIHDTLSPKFKAVEKKNSARSSGGRGKRPNSVQFKFNSIDTIPYWFDPLARVLDCSTADLLALADKYITQHWGYVEDETKNNDPGRGAKYQLTSNGHGDEPIVEKISIYYEYHSLFCAAGEWVQTKEIPVDVDHYETWEEWIKGWALHWDSFWLSDLRDPLPLSEKFWQKPDRSNNWKWSIKRSDFDKLVGINGDVIADYIPVKLGVKIRYNKDNESLSISSALVQPQYGRSLMITLQTSDDLNSYLPFENDRDRYLDNEFEEPTLKYKGWLKRISSDRSGIDMQDELYKEIDKSRIIPGTDFSQWANLEFSEDFRMSYRSETPKIPITILQSWSNEKNEYSYDDLSSNGIQLLIKKETLFNFLSETRQALIIEVNIERNLDSEDYSRYHVPYNLIYLIHPDGTIETISRSYSAR